MDAFRHLKRGDSGVEECVKSLRRQRSLKIDDRDEKCAHQSIKHPSSIRVVNREDEKHKSCCLFHQRRGNNSGNRRRFTTKSGATFLFVSEVRQRQRLRQREERREWEGWRYKVKPLFAYARSSLLVASMILLILPMLVFVNPSSFLASVAVAAAATASPSPLCPSNSTVIATQEAPSVQSLPIAKEETSTNLVINSSSSSKNKYQLRAASLPQWEETTSSQTTTSSSKLNAIKSYGENSNGAKMFDFHYNQVNVHQYERDDDDNDNNQSANQSNSSFATSSALSAFPNGRRDRFVDIRRDGAKPLLAGNKCNLTKSSKLAQLGDQPAKEQLERQYQPFSQSIRPDDHDDGDDDRGSAQRRLKNLDHGVKTTLPASTLSNDGVAPFLMRSKRQTVELVDGIDGFPIVANEDARLDEEEDSNFDSDSMMVPESDSPLANALNQPPSNTHTNATIGAATTTNEPGKFSSPLSETKSKPLKQVKSRIGSNDDDQIKWHRDLIELMDDDLFIVAGTRIEANIDVLPNEASQQRRQRRRAEGTDHLFAINDQEEEEAEGEVGQRERAKRNDEPLFLSANKLQAQTIYFGGFFPWLTDEDNQGANYWSKSEQQQQATSRVSFSKQKQTRRKKQQLQQYENVTLPPLTSASSYTPENRHQLGRFILPAVRLALDHINNNASVLGPYRLEIVPRDTQCNATISLKEFFDMVYEEPKKILLYGDACRVSTDPIAKASYFFDLIQISYADTDPIYTIENYPNFFRVVPSENALSLARIPFIRHFNWTRVGTIYQNLPRYSLPHSKLLTDLERYNIVIKQSVSLPGSVDGLQNRDLGDELRKLKEKDVRIILGNFDEEWALLLFCEAFREKMTGRKYQWILTGVSEDRLWPYYKGRGSSCSEQELLIAMDGYITTDITTVTRSQQPTISGMMAHEYSDEYKRRAEEMNISIEENKFYGYVYDGIWAIALALHRVDSQLKYYNHLSSLGKVKIKSEFDGLKSLLDFDYHKPIWVKLIRNALDKTRFSGVTGTVSFHKNERPGLISFSQFQAFRNTSEVIIGSYDALNDILNLKVGFPIFWRGHSPPIDYTIQRVTPFRINRTLFVIISILAIFGIILAFVFLTINIKFRNQRYIKMSSPYLNNLIIIGCILTYTSVIILGLDSGLTSEYNFPYICNARAWVLMAGFTLAFGSMFSKTFRVHSIFTNIKLHKKVIKDYKLFMVVFILLTFDVCILIVWQYFDPFYRETNNGTSIQDVDNEDVIIVPEMEHCQSKRMTIFLSVIYVYKGLLMAFGCFLAWETRHVSIPALNDSKYIGLSVYNVVIMCVIGASLSFVLRDQQDASFVIISIFIIFCSTTTLCLVFVPKLIELKQNPRSGDHRVRATLKTFKKNYHEEAFGAAASCRDIHGNIIGRGFGVNLNERIRILLDDNTKQRSVLKEKTYELEALTYKYRKIQGMIQSGQCVQAINATVGAPSISLPQQANSPTNYQPLNMLGSRLPAHERVSFTSLKKDGQLLVSAANKSSPLTSSTTQITTTNTTSSTNNHTDFTNDFSSSKIVSNVTTSTNGQNVVSAQIKRTMVAFDCPTIDRKVNPANKKHATFMPQVADNYSQNLIRADNQALKLVSKKLQDIDNDAQKINLNSSNNNSASADKDDANDSQNDLLFTVFSYISKNGKGAKRLSKNEIAENNFNRWSKGPFCTLMVRNREHLIDSRTTNNQICPPGRAWLKQKTQASKEISFGSEEVNASCPDITSKIESKQSRRNTRPTRQLSQQNTQFKAKSMTPSMAKFPRTMSMIEYLGMTEFDLIARRHDKLLHRSLGKRQASCCYEMSVCSYCNQMESRKGTQFSICQNSSEGDVALSSSDPLYSGDLIQTSSDLSCSTCCSLDSPSSSTTRSETFGRAGSSQTSQTGTSQTTASSRSDLTENLSNSHSSTTSSSISNGENSQIAVYCQHHRVDRHSGHCHLHHSSRHLHNHSSEALSCTTSTSSVNKHQQRLKQKSLDNNVQSLCTSGALYCVNAKEAANNSAHIVDTCDKNRDTIDIKPTKTIEEESTNTDQEEGERYLIKCDVLEIL